MGYEVGYYPYEVGQLCGSPSCVEGGKILKGQVRLARQKGPEGKQHGQWYHLECVQSGQKKAIMKKHRAGQVLIGLGTLTVEDKARVNRFFGWVNEGGDQLKLSSTLPERPSGFILPDVSRDRTFWGSAQDHSAPPVWEEQPLNDVPTVWEPFFDSRSQGQSRLLNSEEIGFQSNQLSSPAFASAEATDRVSDQERGVRNDEQANDEMLLMRLELEIKDARVRLANAELEVAKSEGKVESARQKVIEQRLKIERARKSHIDIVIPVM